MILEGVISELANDNCADARVCGGGAKAFTACLREASPLPKRNGGFQVACNKANSGMKKIRVFLVAVILLVVFTSCNNRKSEIITVHGTITGEYASWNEVVIINYDHQDNPIWIKTVPMIDGKFVLPELQKQDLINIKEEFLETDAYRISNKSAFIAFDLEFYIRNGDEYREIKIVLDKGRSGIMYVDRDVNMTSRRSQDIISHSGSYYRIVTQNNMKKGWNILVQSSGGIERRSDGIERRPLHVYVIYNSTNPLPSNTTWEVID